MSDLSVSPARVTIREVSVDDAEAVAALSAELGYPASAEVMRCRIERIRNCSDHAVYVACVDSEVSGWIDLGVMQHLQGEPYTEIGGLVVSSLHRSGGIGRRLVRRAEEWALERGVSKLLVRSQIARERAHAFYLREGFTRTKTSAVFAKELDRRPEI